MTTRKIPETDLDALAEVSGDSTPDVVVVLLKPAVGDPFGLLAVGAPIEYHGVAGWVVYSDSHEIRCAINNVPRDGRTTLTYHPRATGHGLRLRLAACLEP